MRKKHMSAQPMAESRLPRINRWFRGMRERLAAGAPCEYWHGTLRFALRGMRCPMCGKTIDQAEPR